MTQTLKEAIITISREKFGVIKSEAHSFVNAKLT